MRARFPREELILDELIEFTLNVKAYLFGNRGKGRLTTSRQPIGLEIDDIKPKPAKTAKANEYYH